MSRKGTQVFTVAPIHVPARGDGTQPVPLEKVAGKLKTVPLDHSWAERAWHVGTCLGD